MQIERLRQLAGREEIDYPFLMGALADYRSPRDKVSFWLKNKSLIRVKKGLYVFGPTAAREPYSLELLANLIYGPSVISLQYALAHYGLIPERVSTLTSITPKRNKFFDTPIGRFTYSYLPSHLFSLGIDRALTLSNQHYLIATAEKALCDYIYLEDKPSKLQDPKDMAAYLFQELRLDEECVQTLHTAELQHMATQYAYPPLQKIVQFLLKASGCITV